MRQLLSLYYWSVGLGYFGPVMLLALLRSLFQAPQQYDPWLKKRVKRLFKLLNSTPLVEFAEPLPENRALIYMANHSSLIDIPLLKAVIPYYFRGIIAHDQLHYPIYGKLVSRMKNIPIYRNNVRKSLLSFKTAGAYLERGIHITVLPEGNRSLDGQLLPFRKLPFHFAKEAGAAIVPLSISGVFNMKSKHSMQLLPSRIVVRFGSIIPEEIVAASQVEDLMELTRKRIFEGLEPFERGEIK